MWHLTKVITVSGYDWFMRKSTLKFSPCKEGWWWGEIRITPDIIKSTFRGVALNVGKKWLMEYEHIGALRQVGLDGVRIDGEGWPPHFGQAQMLWIILNPIKISNVNQWITIKEPITIQHKNSVMTMYPLFKPQLVIQVSINYLGLGKYTETFCQLEDFLYLYDQVLAAKTQGWPKWLYNPAKLLSKFGWSHMNTIQWPQDADAKIVLEQFALHRVQDIIGTLSVLGGNIAGLITSYCSGHYEDVKLVKQVKQKLIII